MAVASAILWIVSSAFWIWSALLPSPYKNIRFPGVMRVSADSQIYDGVDTKDVHRYFNKQGNINAVAAVTSALAAACAAASLWTWPPAA